MRNLAIAAVISAGAPMIGVTFVSTRMFGGSFRIALWVEIVAFIVLVYVAVFFIAVTNDCAFNSHGFCS